MGPCPSCAGRLEASQGMLFCPACFSSMHTPAALAASARLSLLDGALDAEVDRFAEPIGACPACAGGRLSPGRLAGEPTAQCSRCRGLWVARHSLPRIRAALARRAAAPRISTKPPFAGTLEPTEMSAAALPAALAFGVIGHFVGDDLLVHVTSGMWAHEIGHSIVAWLSGFVAVPLPFVTFQLSDDRAPFGALLLAAALGVGACAAWRWKAWALVVLLGALAAFQCLLTLAMNPAQAFKWVLLSGLGGELVLPTLAMIATHLRVSRSWDLLRYPVLVVAAVTFVRSLLLWTAVAAGRRAIPHGSMLGSAADGDVERLTGFYHVPQAALVDGYLWVGWACVAALASAYAVHRRTAVARA